MPSLLFELAGVEFGPGCDVLVREFDPGAAAVASADVESPVSSGVMPGRDRRRGATWVFGLFTNERDEVAARDAVRPLLAAWASGEDLRPLETLALRYRVADRWRRVYGRPRLFASPPPSAPLAQGRGDVSAEFFVSDPLHYSDAESSLTLGIVPASLGTIVPPVTPPLEWLMVDGAMVRSLTVGGDAPAPVSVTVRGPVRNAVVTVGGTAIRLVRDLAWDESVTVDGRTLTIARADGASVPGMVSSRTRLSDLRLVPGVHSVEFSGLDETGTATATVAWRDAWRSL